MGGALKDRWWIAAVLLVEARPASLDRPCLRRHRVSLARRARLLRARTAGGALAVRIDLASRAAPVAAAGAFLSVVVERSAAAHRALEVARLAGRRRERGNRPRERDEPRRRRRVGAAISRRSRGRVRHRFPRTKRRVAQRVCRGRHRGDARRPVRTRRIGPRVRRRREVLSRGVRAAADRVRFAQRFVRPRAARRRRVRCGRDAHAASGVVGTRIVGLRRISEQQFRARRAAASRPRRCGRSSRTI